ncbi:response regulator [Duganella sp. HH101]|uniref:response regulator n=1 Tax=Duganella sp. HH101 TaxID=1781066 RepID=UPI000874C3E3|nr:response regulator [Duganella sp. HH101]OFA05689.1 signal transduction histidine-protein kinase BarA [Duganella sp. HH101]
MKSLGIKAKVALATSITSVLMIALVTVVQTHRMQDDFTRVLFTQQTALINRTAEELDDKLLMLLDIIAVSARNTPAAIARNPGQLRTYYQDRAVLALFDDLLVINPEGMVIADLPEVPGRAGIDASDRAYFKTVMRARKPLITEPLIGRAGKQPIVQMVAPVLDANGEVVCLLVGVLRLYKDNLLGHLRNAKVGRTGYYFALTRGPQPVYVLHPELGRLLKPRQPNANPATTQALEQDFEGTVDSVNGAGKRTLNSYKALKSVDWVLAASLPAEEAFEPFNGVLYRLLLWGGLASLAAAALIGWLTLRLLAPLIRLRDAIVALRDNPGRFTPLPTQGQDEVGQLTTAFNELMHERLAADARLQSLVEFAPNAIVVVGVDGRIETFNREGERYFGYQRDAVLGQPLEMLVPERLRGQHAGHRVKFFAERLSAEPVRMGDGTVLYGLRRDGSEFPVEINLSAVRTDQGTKVLAVISDITERHRLRLEVEARAEELERERDRAEAANRAKSEFVANMSHEIRTPMNAVLGMVYLLGNTPLTPQQRKYLSMVRVSGQSLLGILNDVLDFSKIEARHMELSPVDFALDDTMNSLATLMTMNASDKELELAISVDPAVPRHLRGDSMRLQQVLVNLAGNAIKFTEQGEVVVSVELSARDEDHALLRFEVRDTGMGMTETQLGQLFQAFSQGDQSITRRFGGTGLGLAITKRLIELMGGQIAVSSTQGRGTSFWFSLPFDVLPELPDERRKPALGNLRLLVADDNRTSREVIAKLIRAWGWHADEVDSGAAALHRYRQSQQSNQTYDVVLADWHMPGMDGLATAKGIREAAAGNKQPIVVMVNAFARDHVEEISNAPEADVVLVKPITSSNLFDALHQALVAKSDGQPQPVADASIAGSLAGRHFLLVEDNALNQVVARGILEHAGATLDVVGDGRQAVERLRAGASRYDLVLMDMQMPVMDGFTATRILREQLRLDLPIIAMTAGVLGSERHRSQEAGITDFIPKPIEVEEMLEVLLRHLPAPAPAPVPAPAAPAATAAEDDLLAAMAAAAAPVPAPMPEPVLVKPAAAAMPAGEASIFNMDALMRVMGKDAKGRAVMAKMVRGAVDTGMTPVEEAGAALQEGRLRDAARLFHSLRGAVGVLGAKRLIQATVDAENAINEQRDEELAQRYQTVCDELELTLAQARAWLEREQL